MFFYPRKDFIIDQQGEGEGVLDDLMDALKTGQAYNRDNRRQKPRQNRKLSCSVTLQSIDNL